MWGLVLEQWGAGWWWKLGAEGKAVMVVFRFAFQEYPSVFCIRNGPRKTRRAAESPGRKPWQWSGHKIMGGWAGSREQQGYGEV